MKEGIKEFVKGLEEIYNEGQKDTWKIGMVLVMKNL